VHAPQDVVILTFSPLLSGDFVAKMRQKVYNKVA
jgi:hypothetical protein